MTDIQIVILDTIKELAIENNVDEDEIKYFQIAYSLASKLCKAKNNEVLDLVIWRCNKPITDISQNEIFTKGRLYEQVDGWIIDNNGDKTELSIFEEYFTSI